MVRLAWDAVAGATGYKIHYGEVSETYTVQQDVGDVTTADVTGLTSGQTYYFAVTAYNDTMESAFSNEVFTMIVSSLSVSPSAVLAGEPITVTVTNGPGNPHDWVAMYPAGEIENHVDWFYLNNEKDAPAEGVMEAVLTFVAPGTPGDYLFQFYRNDSYDVIDTSATVQVTLPALAAPTRLRIVTNE